MERSMIAVLTDAERLLVAETEPAALAELDEDGLVALHDRVRRARNKFVGQYRRAGARGVAAKGGRGKSAQQNTTARTKAEVFEIALARVSTQLARAAKRAAAELREERLAAARGERAARPGTSVRATSATKAKASTAPARPRPDAAAVAKKNASSLAKGARRQAKRDSR